MSEGKDLPGNECLKNSDAASKVLSVAGAVTGGAVGGAIGVVVAGPLGGVIGGSASSLISLLAQLPAERRHQERIEVALKELHKGLSDQQTKLEMLSDEQFKLIGECVKTLLATVDAEKIKYLQSIVLNTVHYGDYSSYESILMTRIIRDISVEEIHFLMSNFSYTTINVYSWFDSEDGTEEAAANLEKLKTKISEEKGLLLLPNEPASLVVNGLVSLGVLAPEQLSLGVHRYKYADIAVKLIVLLRGCQ